MKPSRDCSLAILGWMLLGAVPVCFAGLTPLPTLLRLPPFPGGASVALVIGGVCLVGGVLFLLLSWWQERRDTHYRQTEEACAHAVERQALQATLQEKTFERYPNLTSQEELERFPLWFLRAIHEHSIAGREAIARCLLEEWHVSPSRKQTREKTPDLYACHICGLPDLPSLLFICTRCQQFAHSHCSTLVRQVYEDGSTLAVDPKIRPFCQACLDALQTQGWKLTQDGGGWLLIRQKSDC